MEMVDILTKWDTFINIWSSVSSYFFIIFPIIRILIHVFVPFKNLLALQGIPTDLLIYYVYHE